MMMSEKENGLRLGGAFLAFASYGAGREAGI
jgi:hypothetical protein